ncbi:c-type cytochrome [Geojedonia litorea]|uniref:C-type cytochrome n=1 Tax=Geojedonia litorea TaxID=1268269 RepID=A0ABV9MYF2_9FLAO
MKTKILKSAIFFTGLLIMGCKDASEINEVNGEYVEQMNTEELIKRGNYLVNVIGCNDCHTPKIMTEQGPIHDPNRLLSGHNQNEAIPVYDPEITKSFVLFNMNSTAAVGPWGTSFAANLTPDITGIGTWSEAQFLKAMKEGKYKGLDGSRSLLPPMPWTSFSQMPDNEIKAIFAYLKSIKPIENLVPSAIAPRS